jgi:hypothetical protein
MVHAVEMGDGDALAPLRDDVMRMLAFCVGDTGQSVSAVQRQRLIPARSRMSSFHSFGLDPAAFGGPTDSHSGIDFLRKKQGTAASSLSSSTPLPPRLDPSI